MSIESIVETIKLLLNKHRKGMVKESYIKTAIQNAEIDLYNELLNEFRKTGIVPVKLYPFLKSAAGAFTAGLYDISSDGRELVSCQIQSGTDYWDAKVARNDKEWTSRKLSDLIPDPERPDNPLFKYMKTLTINGSASAALPSGFIKEVAGYVTIGGEDFKAVLLSPEKWGTKDILDALENPEKSLEPDINSISEAVLTAASLSTGSATAPLNLVKAIGFSVKDSSGKEWDGYLVPFSKFKSRNFKDLIEDGEIKKHLSVVDEQITINLGDGSGNLPSTFIKDRGVFYMDYEEGLILSDEDYWDRANSYFLPPTIYDPIARIEGGKIWTQPLGALSIVLPFYKFPTDKTPVGAIGNGKFHIEPIPTGDVTIRYIKFPSERRPVFKVEGANVYVSPVQANDFKFTYLEYPTEKAPLVRFQLGKIECAVASLATANLKANYIKKITPSIYIWNTSGRDITFISGTSEFNDDATSDIVAKALKYLGVSYQDSSSVQFEKILENNDNAQ